MSALEHSTLRLRTFIERASAIGTRAAPGARDSREERCGMCGVPLPLQHRHVLDLGRRELQCACRACSLLFDHAASGGRHYRLVPERRMRLEDFRLDDLTWSALGLPVEVAFFVRDGKRRRVTAFYPSPAGPTESTLPLHAWNEVEEENPALAGLEPDVEALLVNRTGGRTQAFIVGVDECYRLVAVVRQHWRGFGGGDQVWEEITRFFASLDGRTEQRV
jgi:hypothetical protein